MGKIRSDILIFNQMKIYCLGEQLTVFEMVCPATWLQNFVVLLQPADAISSDQTANVQDPDFSCTLVN